MIRGFGDRLRSARKEAGLSVPYKVDHINTYLMNYGFKIIHESTYYAWEKIGTAREVKAGKNFPHPSIYPLLLEEFGIRGIGFVWVSREGIVIIITYRQQQ